MPHVPAFGRHACALVLGLGLLAASAPGALSFSLGSALLPKFRPASTRGQVPASSRPAAGLAGLSMIYMPPRPEGPTTELTLDELKEALDRSVNLPSPKSRESPKVAVQRSPCTSLYGTYRPTTSSGAWKSSGSTRMLKGRPRTMVAPPPLSIGSEPKRPRGRPSKLSKAAVNEQLLTEFLVRAAKVLLLNGGSLDSNLFGQHWKTMHRSAPLASFKSHKGVAVHQMFSENAEFFEVKDTDRQKVKMFEIKKEALASYLEEVGAVVTLDSLDAEEELVKLRTGVPITEEADGVVPDSELEPEFVAELAHQIQQVVAVPGPVQQPEVEYYDAVPVQGKARNSLGMDRRKAKALRLSKPKVAGDFEEEKAPAAPERHPDDACTRAVVSLYNGWAADGRDVVMEVSNEPPLSATLREVVEGLAEARPNLMAVDVGCGNGWAARLTKAMAPEARVTAVDAASRMVQRATELDAEGACAYEIGDVAGDWEPEAGVDLVLAVELLHLVEDPAAVLEKMARWLRPGGKVIVTLECYKENRLSASWATDLGVPMKLLEEKEWVAMMEAAGLASVEAKRSMPAGPWPGMLVMSASKA